MIIALGEDFATRCAADGSNLRDTLSAMKRKSRLSLDSYGLLTLAGIAVAALVAGLSKDGWTFLSALLPEIAGFGIGGVVTVLVLDLLREESKREMWHTAIQSVRSALLVTLEATLFDFETLYGCVGPSLIDEHSGKQRPNADDLAGTFRNARQQAKRLQAQLFRRSMAEEADTSLDGWSEELASMTKRHPPARAISKLDTRLWRLATFPLANIPPDPRLEAALSEVRRAAESWARLADGVTLQTLHRIQHPEITELLPFDVVVRSLTFELGATADLLGALAEVTTAVPSAEIMPWNRPVRWWQRPVRSLRALLRFRPR